MKATLSDRIYLTDLSFERAESIKQSLTRPNPKYYEAQKFGRSTWNLLQYLELFEQTPDGLAIPHGAPVNWLGVDAVQDNRLSRTVQITTKIETRPYQERVIRLAINAGGGVIVAPTGSGKTTMGIEIAARFGERCLILVKSLDLAKQWQAAIKRFTGLDCGLIGGGKMQEGQAFTVALMQTLVKQETGLDYGLVIVDECHNIPAAQAYAVINRQAAKYRFGLSATLQRRDNLEFMIHAALGQVAAEVEANELNGSVLPVMVLTLHYDFKGSPDSWGAFITQLERDDQRNRLLVDSAIKSSRTTGTAVLTATVSHAETLTRLVNQLGVDALLLHGKLAKKEREQRMMEAPNSPLIIGTLSLLGEGIDWPHVGGIIFAAPVSAAMDKTTPAATRLIQSIGRARRPYPGKSTAFVLDIIDRHPFGLASYKKRSEIYQQQGFRVC
ncbi:MAG: DEAD/DEAH box helicase [Methylovulum sp.]|nr:DEAD/DEAH box helicase [Methylovulum sp.]